MQFILLLCFLLPTYSQAATHRPQAFLQSIKNSTDEGEQVVKHFCANCHSVKPLIPLGAPRIKEEQDWAPRLKKDSKILIHHTNEGFNAMPARGGCFECSDEQLILAIVAMLPPNLQNSLLIELKDHKKNKQLK